MNNIMNTAGFKMAGLNDNVMKMAGLNNNMIKYSSLNNNMAKFAGLNTMKMAGLDNAVLKQFNDSRRLITQAAHASALGLTKFSLDISPAIRNYEKQMQGITKSLAIFQQDYIRKSIMPIYGAFSEYEKMNRNLIRQIQTMNSMAKMPDNLMKSIKTVANMTYGIDTKQFSSVMSSINHAFINAGIANIPLADMEDYDLESSLDKEPVQEGYSDLTASITVAQQKKKLGDLTVDEFTELLKKCIIPAQGFSLGALVLFLYGDYVKDAARILLEITFAFMFTIVSGQYDDDVKVKIENRIEETMVVKDVRKTITRYVGVNPYSQIAFLRTESFLRKGKSKKAPVVSSVKITTNTILTIVDHKKNWVLVQVDNGDSCGEAGWIEESKVVKFKRISSNIDTNQ